MKKRTICLLLAMIMVLSIVLAGCSKTAETPAADETPAATEPAETTDNTETPEAPEETAEPALEQKTIQLMITGAGKQANSDKVWAAFNEQLQQYVPNTTVEFIDVPFEEYSEKFSEMENLKSEYGELAFTVNVEGGEGADRLSEIKTEYNKLKADADKIKDEYLAPSVEKAKEAYAKLQAGEEFSKVAEEYSPDTEGNKNGLLISVKHSGSYDWSKEVKDAFAKIKQGEYTEAVKDDEGVHILYYLSDEPAGEVGLDSVKDKIKEILMIDVQEDEWNQILETWKNDESVSLNEELVRSVTYSPVSVG